MWLYPFTMIIVQIYFFITGVIILKYAVKSKTYPEKADHPEYFKNEIIIACMFFALTIIYPWIFNAHIDDELVRHQCYFHVWDSLTVQFCIWPIYLKFAQKNNAKLEKMLTFTEWKDMVREEYSKKDHVKADMKRKLMHLIPPVLVIGMFYVGYWLNGVSMGGVHWDYESTAVFWSISFGFSFEYVMIIADLLRLNKFDRLGQFARNWAEGMIVPKELDTFTSSNAMILAFIPFYFAPFKIIFSIVVITAVSDAAASLVGKKWGKKRNPNDPKTREGYVAGALATYLCVIGMNALIELTEPVTPVLTIHLMGVAAAIAFFLVDRFARQISDNFLNPAATGIAMIGIYIIF